MLRLMTNRVIKMIAATNHRDSNPRQLVVGSVKRPLRRVWFGAGLALLLLIVAACSSSSATASPSTVAPPSLAGAMMIGTTHSASDGDYLTGPTGMTLYTLNTDSAGVSTCVSADCAPNWPPLVPAALVTGPAGSTGVFGSMTRPDGSLQVTYNGWPLYYYAGDSAVGDTNGQGKLGVWFVAALNRPLAGSAASPMASASDLASPSAMASASASASTSGY
jgi:predicted lipoprotein with Yx(FWY)xxD motif